MISWGKVSVILTGVLVLFCATGFTPSLLAKDVERTEAPAVPTLEERIEWEHKAIRLGYKFDIVDSKEIEDLSCFSQKNCPAGFPSQENQYLRIKKALAAENCKPSKDLNELESIFCSLLQQPSRDLLDRLHAKVQVFYPKSERDWDIRLISFARGYVKGPRQCQQFVREMVGDNPLSWTAVNYQNVVDCKMLFEGADAKQLESDLAYFRFARHAEDKDYCDGIEDADIKAFCKGPFTTPLPDNP